MLRFVVEMLDVAFPLNFEKFLSRSGLHFRSVSRPRNQGFDTIYQILQDLSGVSTIIVVTGLSSLHKYLLLAEQLLGAPEKNEAQGA